MSVDHFSSKTPEWYTPPSVISRVQATFGGEIDCDPCADTPTEQVTDFGFYNTGYNVPARVHYTQDDDGLGQTWNGDVYMNPPYGRKIGKWVEKAIGEYVDQRCDNLVMLLPARVDTAWWRTAAFSANGIAIVRGRLTFSDFATPAPFPSAVIYYGNNLPAFRAAFAPPFADHYDCAPTPYVMEVAS